MDILTFSEPEIQQLFGHEAAEDEDIKRLREYYVKGRIYDHVASDLPLRILVGHKGTGKSALFQVAMAEERDDGRITVLIRPNDVLEINTDTSDFLKAIRDWKAGISTIIAEKVIAEFGEANSTSKDHFKHSGGALLNFLEKTFQDIIPFSTAPAKKAYVDNFLKTKKISIYIDDLDRGWQGKKEDIYRISALLNAVRDISTESRGLQFRIALRSDVYYLVRTSDESTDKIEGAVIWYRWTNHEIFVLLVKRVESFFGRQVNDQQLLKMHQSALVSYLKPVLVDRFEGRGHWQNAPIYRVFMSLIRKRPRDLVKLLTLSARNARDSNDSKIRTKHLEDSFEEYSQGRLQDTINEYRAELPNIERLLISMKPSKREKKTKEGYVYPTDKLLKKIGDIISQGDLYFANGRAAAAKDLAGFLYKINFLTARKDNDQEIIRKYYEENRYLSNQFSEFGFDWEIHPAYRWALQPDSIDDIFKNIKLSTE